MKKINKRDFLKLLGGSVAAAAGISACTEDKNTGVNYDYSDVNIPKDKMEYRVNHNTGDKVSLLGYGCMRLPAVEIEENKWEIDQEAWNELVDYAIDHGVNYFDTAPVYGGGHSEEATGKALKRHPRDKFFVATKMSTYGNNPESKSSKRSLELYNNSFKELQVDYIDYYLLHAVGLGGIEDFNKRFIDNGVLDFLLEERKAGRIRNLGWSFHGDVALFDHLLAMDIHWDFVQIQLNYMDWKHAGGWNVNAEYLYGELEKRNIPAVIMEPLLGGRLAKLNYFGTHMLRERKPNSSTASWAFRFAGTPKNVLTVLSGMTFKEHLQDNILTYSNFEPLSDDDNKMLEEVAQYIMQYPYINCTDCKYCLPCPYGVDIPGVFMHYNRCLDDGNFPKGKQDEDYAKSRRAFLIDYNRRIPKPRQADHCIGCAQCNKDCPQHLDIANEMVKVDRFVEQLKQDVDSVEVPKYIQHS